MRRTTAVGLALAGAASSFAASPATAGADGGAADSRAAAAVDPDAPTVASRVDKNEARVGDLLMLTITAIGRKGVPANLPSAMDLDPFSVVARAEKEQDLGDGRVRREFTLSVAAYEPGDLSIPSVEVTYLGKAGEVLSARTSPVPVRIVSLLANEPEAELKENAVPVSVWQQDLLLVYIAAGLAIAALGGVVTWVVIRRLRARAARRPGPPPRPAHERALAKLDALGAGGFPEDADHRPFTFAVSEVIREYVGARFGFDSLELTTDELCGVLRRRAARELVIGEVEGWLTGCDLVKFAKLSPSGAEARGMLETAIRIVESTRPRPAPEEAAARA